MSLSRSNFSILAECLEPFSGQAEVIPCAADLQAQIAEVLHDASTTQLLYIQKYYLTQHLFLVSNIFHVYHWLNVTVVGGVVGFNFVLEDHFGMMSHIDFTFFERVGEAKSPMTCSPSGRVPSGKAYQLRGCMETRCSPAADFEGYVITEVPARNFEVWQCLKALHRWSMITSCSAIIYFEPHLEMFGVASDYSHLWLVF